MKREPPLPVAVSLVLLASLLLGVRDTAAQGVSHREGPPVVAGRPDVAVVSDRLATTTRPGVPHAGTPVEVVYQQGESSSGGGEELKIPAPLPIAPRPGPDSSGGLLPGAEALGPPHGLTLDQAIELLLGNNPDLRSKFYEIPKAEADVLTAGLRDNPLLFFNTGGVPYGSYSPQRPGAVEYGISVVYPIDVTGQRRARQRVSRQANKVREAQFQNAVREAIDDLYEAFVDVLAADLSVRATEEALASLDRLANEVARRPEPGPGDWEAAEDLRIERETTALLLEDQRGRLEESKRVLGALLGMPPDWSSALEARGALRDTAPPPPSTEELVRLALGCRPDLLAHRLGVGRARADVELAEAQRFAKVYLLYTPYDYRDQSQADLKNTLAWGGGLFVSLPLYNRNQGNLRRANVNVLQARSELGSREGRVVLEVEQAVHRYRGTGDDLRRMETEILPRVLRKRQRAEERYRAGEIGLDELILAQRDHNSMVRHYRDTLVRHRRSMLALNTAVGRRILP